MLGHSYAGHPKHAGSDPSLETPHHLYCNRTVNACSVIPLPRARGASSSSQRTSRHPNQAPVRMPQTRRSTWGGVRPAAIGRTAPWAPPTRPRGHRRPLKPPRARWKRTQWLSWYHAYSTCVTATHTSQATELRRLQHTRQPPDATALSTWGRTAQTGRVCAAAHGAPANWLRQVPPRTLAVDPPG